MTFSEALEAMKQGYKVRREDWEDGLYRVMAFNSFTIIENSNGENIIAEYVSNILATDWGIYNEPKPEPQFEIGELVMMRDRIDSKCSGTFCPLRTKERSSIYGNKRKRLCAMCQI